MPMDCPPGTEPMYRHKKKKTKKGESIRLGGCGKRGKFTSIEEIRLFKRKR